MPTYASIDDMIIFLALIEAAHKEHLPVDDFDIERSYHILRMIPRGRVVSEIRFRTLFMRTYRQAITAKTLGDLKLITYPVVLLDNDHVIAQFANGREAVEWSRTTPGIMAIHEGVLRWRRA